MYATLHLPSTAPRPLTATELAALSPHQTPGQHLALGVSPADAVLAELLGTSIPGETLASGPAYLIIVPENAAEYGFAPTPSATADFARLTGMEPDEDEPLVGPLLFIEA
ncbi:hypothetical protein [Hymenobacter psoromatis]|uniref:hypothetical protein n=1 Tax=Hymenobacter psoromatis TaxID=1484116 RepID=UPI001CBD360D|nr:hypothetical protein [Hymenobacter psoromatis]